MPLKSHSVKSSKAPPEASSDARSRELSSAIQLLLRYGRRNGWAGYDPYDALNSVLLQRLGLFKAKLPRLAFTQFLKRSPINFRRLLMVPKEQNPKGMALVTSALIKLERQGLSEQAETKQAAARLLELRSPNWKRYCWGYNFSWQTRTYLVPRGTPNIICTTFAGNALLDAYDHFRDPAYLDCAISAGHFLLEGLSRSGESKASCFSYTPVDKSQIHNANLLGGAYLARLYTHNQSQEFLGQALASARFSAQLQREDGSWPYGEGAKQQWIDSFHTGYNLDALKTVKTSAGTNEFDAVIGRGFKFYREHFFTEEGVAKYFHNKIYPIDVHSIAQALITLTKFRKDDPGGMELAWKVCHWGLENMRRAEGHFFVQKHPAFTNRIPYMRWAQAWMLLGLATLAEGFRESDTLVSRGM